MTNNHGTSEPPAPRSDSSDPIPSAQTADTTVIDPPATINRRNNQLVVQGQAPATDPTEPQASAVDETQQERAGLTASAIPAAVADLDLSQSGSVQAGTGRSAPSGQVASDGLGLPDRESVRSGTSGSSQVTVNPSLARNLTGSRIPTPGSQPARSPADVFTQPSASRVNPNYHEPVGQNPMVWARDSDNHQRLQFSQPQLNQLPTRSQPVGPAPPVSARDRHILGYFNPEWQNRADILTREASGRPRPRYSPYPLPPAPTILTQQAPESSRHRGAAPSSISNSQQTYTNFSLVQVQPEVAGREGLSVFTQSRAVSPQAARCPLTRTDQRDEELEEELYHHTWSARDQVPST